MLSSDFHGWQNRCLNVVSLLESQRVENSHWYESGASFLFPDCFQRERESPATSDITNDRQYASWHDKAGYPGAERSLLPRIIPSSKYD